MTKDKIIAEAHKYIMKDYIKCSLTLFMFNTVLFTQWQYVWLDCGDVNAPLWVQLDQFCPLGNQYFAGNNLHLGVISSALRLDCFDRK